MFVHICKYSCWSRMKNETMVSAQRWGILRNKTPHISTQNLHTSVKMLHFCHRLFIYGFYFVIFGCNKSLCDSSTGCRTKMFRMYLVVADWLRIALPPPRTELGRAASLRLVAAGASWDKYYGVFPVQSHLKGLKILQAASSLSSSWCRQSGCSCQSQPSLLAKWSWGHATSPTSYPPAPSFPLGDLDYQQVSLQKLQPLLLISAISVSTQSVQQAFILFLSVLSSSAVRSFEQGVCSNGK